jgi:hypothetical protein
VITGECARHWIYVSGDVDIDRLADDNNAIRAINQALKNVLGPRAMAAARRRHAKRGGS